MIKEWYINIHGNEEGPYSIDDLKKHPEVNSETLVWKEGFIKWVPLCEVKELQSVLKDKKGKPKKKPIEPEIPARVTPDGLVMEMRGDPPPTLFWILLTIILILYLIRILWFL